MTSLSYISIVAFHPNISTSLIQDHVPCIHYMEHILFFVLQGSTLLHNFDKCILLLGLCFTTPGFPPDPK